MKRTLYLLCLMAFAAVTLAEPSEDTEGTPVATRKAPKLTLFSAFAQSFSSIIVSELGDKTFFIAAIMSMRYNRIAVLAGALLALLVMTFISTAFGSIVPLILPPHIAHIIITVLFFFFGVKLLYDALSDKGDDEHDEQAEVEQELNQVHAKLTKNSQKGTRKDAEIEYIAQEDKSDKQLEEVKLNVGDLEGASVSSPSKKTRSSYEGVSKKLVFWQVLSMTFLGEWGDRSQITTIALAAEGNALVVSIGSFLGHVVCTSLAVAGGKFLAKKISEKTVNISGGILFLIFGIHNLLNH